MGAQISVASNKINNEVLSESYSKCPRVTASNMAELTKIEHEPNASCPKSEFRIDQNAAVDATCVLSNMQESLAKVLSETSAKVQGGFGIGAGASMSDIRNILQNKVEQDCGDAAAINAVKASDIKTKACDFLLLQNADAKTTCQLASVQKTALDVSAKAQAEVTGFLGGFGGILVIIVALAVAGGGFALYMKNRNSEEETDYMDDDYTEDQDGGYNLSDAKNMFRRNSFSIITVTLLLLVLLFTMFSTKDKKLSSRDMEKFHDNLKNVSDIYQLYQERNNANKEVLPEFDHDYQHESLDRFYQPLI